MSAFSKVEIFSKVSSLPGTGYPGTHSYPGTVSSAICLDFKMCRSALLCLDWPESGVPGTRVPGYPGTGSRVGP
eukprot:1500653-Rhodomonas_salina.1